MCRHIEKKINIVKNIIMSYFYENNIHMSSCLAQSFILYKFILNLTQQNNSKPLLVKGYIINNVKKIYYGHFWVEFNDNVHDVATETYLLDYDKNHHDEIKTMQRVLATHIPDYVLNNYENADEPLFHFVREHSYVMCMMDGFLMDVKEKAPPEIYEKIQIIYNKIVKPTEKQIAKTV